MWTEILHRSLSYISALYNYFILKRIQPLTPRLTSSKREVLSLNNIASLGMALTWICPFLMGEKSSFMGVFSCSIFCLLSIARVFVCLHLFLSNIKCKQAPWHFDSTLLKQPLNIQMLSCCKLMCNIFQYRPDCWRKEVRNGAKSGSWEEQNTNYRRGEKSEAQIVGALVSTLFFLKQTSVSPNCYYMYCTCINSSLDFSFPSSLWDTD